MANNPFRAAYDLLVDELEHILNSKEIVPELSNQNVVLPLLRAIKICEFLEDKLEVPQNQRKSLGFLKTISNYYAISNLHVDSYYYIDETTLMDDIKYLQVFSTNTLHKDYKDLTPRQGAGQSVNQSKNVHTAHFDRSAKNSNSSNPSTTEPAIRGANNTNNTQPTDDGNYDYTHQENPYGNGPFGGMSNFFGGLFGYNYNAGDMGGGSPEDQAAAMAASNRLNSEIFSGKIYIYRTKPKIIPIGKIILGILCLLLICVVIIQVALSQSVIYMRVDTGTALYNYLNQISDGYVGAYYQNGFNVGTIMSSAEAASWFFAIFFILMFGWEAWIQLRPSRNINDKYKMHIGYLLFVSIMVLIFFITNFSSATIPKFMFANWNAWVQTFHATSSFGIVAALYAFTIIYVILLCTCIAIAIIAWIFKPKQDFQRLNDIYNRYFQEARSQFGGM